ncbi:ABC-2 type transport system ATP-binding protein [Chitinophaga costaii]|uniref:ABC-2 type transport system ATP-binding protein n=1 Tax=Chitinophaga costaii TaxID=1335309 RepID=A0A1C3Z8W3_9BACT|nr:ABC transporter ATP-binding protein [Chitinophaga costaii]PUZ30275.1 ABC transporter ATP-binding protein [Chitinophaga costaii]SCB78702.1 ABC-2 type transport system ATP-binding protein [Chitinophaga costaii]
MISFNQVEKYYGDTLALSIPQLTLEAGIYWIQGENGAGKTTCLKMLAGLLPFKGQVLLDDHIDSRKAPIAYRKKVNYAVAEPLYPEFLTGHELIQLYLDTKGPGPYAVEELARTLGAGSYLQTPVGTYSSGMLKKLSLLLAFLGNPSLILLDEPLITLDVATVAAMYGLISRMHATGVSFMITTHQALSEEGLLLTGTLQVAHKTMVRL